MPDNELWQVLETETIQEEDYEKIEELGFYSFVDWLLKNRLNDPDSKMEAYNQYKPMAIQRFADSGYVILNYFSLVIPFEHICGGRSLCNFLADDLCEGPERVEKILVS